MAANNRNSLEKGNLPTITIIDSIEPSQNDKLAKRNCCGCIPERFGVFAILSMYLFFGLFATATSFAALAFTSQTSDTIYFIISGCLNVFLTIISALGINAIKKEKAVLMYRLSITFWVYTIFTLIFSATLFILDIVYKSSLVKDCEETVESLKTSGEYFDDVNCVHVADVYLIKEAIRLFFVETISMYFAYVIFRYANQMLRVARDQTVLPIANGQQTPTYFVYSNQPPTSNDWTPPPTYTVRPTNPLPDDFNSVSRQTSN
jgi:hypothetical protein